MGQSLDCNPRGKNHWLPYEYKYIENTKYKKCRKCNEYHIMDVNHFNKNSKTEDGYNNICKQCLGGGFDIYVADGYQICKKCNRELLLDFKYFPKLEGEKNFRKVCRECNPKYKGFLEDNYKKQKHWTTEDEIKFIELYPNYTNEELRNIFYPELTDKQMSDKAWKIGIKKSEDTYLKGRLQQAPKVSAKLKGRVVSEERKIKQSITMKKQFENGRVSYFKGRIVSDEERRIMSQRVKGLWEGENNPRYKKPLFGENNGRWMGGITGISTALRENIYEWKRESMQYCNYKCILTGGEFDNIHHLIPFSGIIKEALNILNLEIKGNLGEYKEEDRESLILKVQELHRRYGVGVCIHREVHKLFHDTFSYTSFNREDFQKFIKNYFNGDYDDKLENRLKSENSHRNYKEAIKMASFYYAEK